MRKLKSFLFSDGRIFKALSPVRVDGRSVNGDRSPSPQEDMNSHSAAGLISEEMMLQIEKKILQTTFDGLRKDGKKASVPFFPLLHLKLQLIMMNSTRRSIVYTYHAH